MRNRIVALSIAGLAIAAAVSNADLASAKKGADDPAGHIRQSQGADNPTSSTPTPTVTPTTKPSPTSAPAPTSTPAPTSSKGADNPGGNQRRGRGGGGGGADNGANHR